MSGSFRQRQSKWDHKDSDGLTENLHDKAQTRRPREPVSPRGSRRHDSRSKEKMIWEQEGNDTRMSTGVVESRQHNSRSPRNVWGRLHSRSRSRSRSRSPSHYQRREPIGNDRSRNRSGVSSQICRNFAAGRCNRGSSCHFLHQDAQPYDNRQPLDCSPREDWESRQRGVGGSRYSPVDTNDYAPRSEKSNRICSEFLKGRCRRGASCRYEHPDLVDEFKDNLIDDVHRDRDRDRSGPRRSRDTYSQRNHGREPVDDDVHQDRDRVGLHRSRDAFSHRSHDREPLDDDIHQDRDRDRANRSRDAYSHRKYDREPSDVFEKGPIDDVHRDRDNFHRNRDTYSHQNHDREHADVFENRPVDDGHRDRDNAFNSRDTYTHRNHDSEPADMFEKRPVEDDLRDRDDSRRNRDTHQIHDHKLADVYEKGPVDDAYRDRDNDHKARNTYRSRDREPHKRGGTLCKFFASGNCANGNRCRFIHEVRETLSPGRRGQDDKWGSDHKVESNWDGPTGKDAAAMRNMPPVRGWGEDENKAIDEPPANSRMTPVDNDRIQIKDEKPPLLWETENSAPITSLSASRGVENVSRDMEMSPRDVLQHPLSSSNSHPPSLSDISFPTVQPNLVGEACYEKPYPVGFQEPPKVHNEPFAPQIPSHREEKPIVYHGEGRNIIPTTNIPPQQGFFQADQIIAPLPTHFPSQTMNVQSQQGAFQTDLNVAVQPSSGPSAPTLHFQIPSMNVSSQQSFFPTEQNLGAQSSSAPSLPSLPSLPVPQGQAQFPSEISEGNRVQPSHNPSSFLNSDGSQAVDATQSGLVVATAASLSTVSDEQLAQLSTLSASLAQLLENRHQLPQLGSSGFPSEPTMQMNQIPETSKQYDPISDSAEPNVHNLSVDQVVDDEDVNMKQQEPVIVSTDYEKVKKTADRSINVPENRPSEDEGDDGNKSKDTKAIRPFKFALAEFVKDLLKPFWKDGQVSKDAYKAIVKKVVDKVIETQGLQIPQTKEKIDVYLSCSKPKIEKLVQAYVGKFQKN